MRRETISFCFLNLSPKTEIQFERIHPSIHLISSSFSSLLLTAFLPAWAIEQLTIRTLPWKLLVSNSHVVRLRSMLPVRVINEQQILRHGQNTNGCSNDDGDLHPLDHLCNFLLVGNVVSFLDFLLLGKTSFKVLDGLLFHLLLGSETGDGLGRATLGRLDGAGCAPCECCSCGELNCGGKRS